MIDPSNVTEYQEMLAELNGIDKSNINHPLTYYFEPEEKETLTFFQSKSVATVGDLLLWRAFYGHWFNTGVVDFNTHVDAVLERLKD